MNLPRLSKWNQATKAYVQAGQPDTLETEVADIISFMESAYWQPALSLINSSKYEVQIGVLNGLHAGGVGYSLGGKGFYCVWYENGDRKERYDVVVEDVAKAFRAQHQTDMFLDFIYEKLDSIADACPKQKE